MIHSFKCGSVRVCTCRHARAYECVLASTTVKSTYGLAWALIPTHWAQCPYFELIRPVWAHFNYGALSWFRTLTGSLTANNELCVGEENRHLSHSHWRGPLFPIRPGLWKAKIEGLWFLLSARVPVCPVHKHASLWDGQENNRANSRKGARRTMQCIDHITDVKHGSIFPIALLFLEVHIFCIYTVTGKARWCQ